MATTVDQTDDSEVRALDIGEVRQLLNRYREFNSGVEARAEEEASADQLAGLRHKLLADVAPYCDFGVFRPYGARLGKTLKFVAKVWLPESGAYVNKELPGPPSFDDWRRSWRVFRFAMVVLGVASTARLDRYYERVQQQWADYGTLCGQNLWWLSASPTCV